MKEQNMVQEPVTIHTENIGGIEEATVEFEPGVTIRVGRNATNKTSLLQAIMAGLGSNQVSLKNDADHGSVTLQIGGEEYTRKLERRNGQVVFEGEPYRENTDLADLFAFLLPSNEARRTVELGGDLREVIMEPIDTAAIQSEIEQLQREKNELEDEIQRREQLDEEITQLKQRRAEIENKIERKEDTLETKRAELESESADRQQAQTEQSELETKMQELQETHRDLEDIEFQLESERDSLESLTGERSELVEAQDELAEKTTRDLEQIQSEISRLRAKKQQLEAEMSELQGVIQFNEDMLDGSNEELTPALRDGGEEAVTDQLLADDSTVCWTCGTNVSEERIEKTVNALREFRQTKYTEQQEIEDELSTLKDEKSTVKQRQKRRESVDQKRAEVESEIERRQSKIEELETEHQRLQEKVQALEKEVTELEEEDRSEILDLQNEVNRLELELERLQDDREEVTQRIDDRRDKRDELDQLRRQREDVVEQLQELRNRVDRIENEAIEEFNTHMEAVLEILEYENLDRIWLDRVEQEHRKGRKNVRETVFRLHVVRSDSEGVAYEDEFQHLSESEREVTALIFALAGYLVHDVHEEVPFLLLDSLEAIDSQRVDTLLDYLGDYAEYLVVTLLPEDAKQVETQHQKIEQI